MTYWQKINNIHLKALSVALPILLTFLLFKGFVLILVFLAFAIGGIITVIAIFISWAQDFKNRNQPKIDDRDPIIIAIENCQTKDELPDFCIILQNLPPSLSEKYFWVYVATILWGCYIFYDIFTGGFKDALDIKNFGFFITIVYLLKHWNNLVDEHQVRLTANQKLPNPYLEVNHHGIVYFDGIESFLADWSDIVSIARNDENKFATDDIIIETNTQFIKINGYYETISIYDIYDVLCDYWFIIKNNRRQLKIT